MDGGGSAREQRNLLTEPVVPDRVKNVLSILETRFFFFASSETCFFLCITTVHERTDLIRT